MAHHILIMLFRGPQFTVAGQHHFIKVNMTKRLYYSKFISFECGEYFVINDLHRFMHQ